MLQERRGQIVEKVRQFRMVKVSDLIKEYDVSIETIRRDLEYLEQKGYLKRVYGGAVLYGLYGEEPSYEHREIVHFEEKKTIARKAAELIEDGDTLFIEVGTTVLEAIYCLRSKRNLTIITNATSVAREMIQTDGNRVILLGGELRTGEQSVYGFLTEQNLQHFYANKLLMGVGGLSIKNGFTDYHIQEANIRRMMIERSDKVIALADYSKFEVTAMNHVCPLSDVDVLVTDSSAPEKIIQELRAGGMTVLVAEST